MQTLESDCLGESPALLLQTPSQYETLNILVPQFPYL